MTLLSMLDRFEQAAVTYETSTDKADRDELHAARRAIMEAFEAPQELHRDAICKLTKGDEWVTCGESVVAEYLAREYQWDYQGTAEARSMALALWKYWHDQQKARAEALMEREAELVKALHESVKQLDTIIADGTPTDWTAWRDDLRAALKPSLEQE